MNENALIVDDSLTIRMDLAEAFENAGFQPILCATAAEAREAMTHPPIAIVVLDVILPDGDGVELLRELRASPGGDAIAVLMLSSEAEVKDRVRGLRTGADEYVGKPYDTGYVVARARALVRARQGDPGPRRPTTVLVIDDSITYREALRASLEEAGYAVMVASSGEEGLRFAADRRPDAVVVDGILPGIDGATVIRRIRLDAALRAIPCVLLTASESGGAELRALDAGADAFVRKDDDVGVVLARIGAVLRGKVPRAGVKPASLLGPKKILAVDDSATYLDALGDTLRSEGYDVILARSGEEALELLSVQPVDCILLDLMMPGLSGEETCRRIKAAPSMRDIPLVMLTAVEDRTAMIDGLGAGADDFISKSGELETLKARVRAQIRRKQFEDENRRIREDLLHRELEATETRAARDLAETRAVLVEELERKNQELEAFSYSVSHDLRAPLRGIGGFCQALLEDYNDRLDAQGQDYLRRVQAAATRMNELIDDLMALSRVGRADLLRSDVDLSALAREVTGELRRREPDRRVEVDIAPGMLVRADHRLLRVALENLLGNAWKFTARVPAARISVGAEAYGPGATRYFVRDNGAGFDMVHGEKLFRPFQRLHADADFAGTGIGLATVQRILDRHGGMVWAEAAVGVGATFYFTLPPERTGGRS